MEIQRQATENTCTDVTDVSGMQTLLGRIRQFTVNILFTDETITD